MDVAAWLRELGLDQYEAAFRANDVDAEVLPTLTVDDLKDLGIASIGHRRRMLEAIAALRSQTSPVEPVAAVSPSPLVDPIGQTDVSETTAERRPLSVMFCDLVGSTALSARLDLEDLREVIRSYQARVAATIQPFNGFIARYVGDGVLIYFGWPQAHETDAERAVRAGLAVAAAISEAPVANQTLQMRIGIATGLVVIGEPIGSGDARQQTAIGETPNRAARLQSLAGPGQVMIDTATRRQVGNLFECRDLGTMDLKGLPAPVAVWQVVVENRTLGQFEALRSGLTPLVGRDEEMDLLLRRWTQAKAGNGRVVLISAEPGVGKSRLAERLAERLTAEPHLRLRYFCSPHHQDSALYPVIAQMERAAGFAYGDTPDTKLAKLQALLTTTEPPNEDAALIAELHGLLSAGLAPLKDLTPKRRKEKTFEALLHQLEGLARQQPVLMVFDDLHWIDPSSRELLDRLIERIAAWPVLLLALFRPEFQPPWVGQPHVTLLTLARLDRRDTAAMVAGVSGHVRLPPEMVAEITERTDGVPLFVEEVTKAVLEAGMQASAALSAVPHPGQSVPVTLHASLMARLDRLGPAAREVAQAGAAIGREFGYDLLTAMGDLPEPQLRAALDRLSNAGLVFVRGTPPDASYLFKHALVQDAAYGTLLRSRRQSLHRRIAAILEERFPEIVQAQPALLAHHYAEAELTEQAITYLYRAAQQAITRSAMAEAVAQLHQGLAMLARLPDGTARWRQELDLQSTLGVPLIVIKGMGAPEVGQAYARARELCFQLGDTSHLTAVLFGLWWFYQVRADLRAAHEVAAQLLDLARPDPADRLQAHRAMAHTLFSMGKFTPALAHFEQAIALYDPQRHRSLAATFGQEPGILTRGFTAHVLWYLGYPDRALKAMSEALAQAQEVAHPFSLAFALDHTAWLRHYRRETAETRERAEADIEFSGAQGFPFFLAQGTILRGWALAEQGLHAEGIAQIHQGLAAHQAGGALLIRPYWLSLLAQAYARSRRAEDGLCVLDEALAMSHGQHIWKAELHRLRGELLLAHLGGQNHAEAAPVDASILTEAGRSFTQAESCFQHAIEVAREQRGKSLELRASTSLARLWKTQGKHPEARDLLDPIYNWFTEGFDTPDLKDAKALLDELA
ncbi:MAG: AAA family ATPase [Rhodopila sp.]